MYLLMYFQTVYDGQVIAEDSWRWWFSILHHRWLPLQTSLIFCHFSNIAGDCAVDILMFVHYSILIYFRLLHVDMLLDRMNNFYCPNSWTLVNCIVLLENIFHLHFIYNTWKYYYLDPRKVFYFPEIFLVLFLSRIFIF